MPSHHSAVPSKSLKTTPKISVKIWRPIIDKLDAKLDGACLRRDAYLARLLNFEIDALNAEVSIPNSLAAHDYVVDRLDQLDRKLVSLALPSVLTARLNEICERKRIVRDAFFNRLFLLLAASPKLIDRLFFPDDWDWRAKVWREFKHEDAFFKSGFYPLEAPVDPFWAIRVGLELMAAESEPEDYVEPQTQQRIQVVRDLLGHPQPLPSIYNTYFDQKAQGKDLLGLNCFMPDRQIPEHEASREYSHALDALLESL